MLKQTRNRSAEMRSEENTQTDMANGGYGKPVGVLENRKCLEMNQTCRGIETAVQEGVGPAGIHQAQNVFAR